MTVFFLRGIARSKDPELQRQFRDLEIDFGMSRVTDLFFTATQSAPVFETEAERALVLGDFEQAFRSLRRALYHYPSSTERLQAAEYFFERAAELELADEVLLAAFQVLVAEADLDRAAARDARRLDAWTRTLRAALDQPIEAGDMPFAVERIVRRAGPAGRALAAAWNRADAAGTP